MERVRNSWRRRGIAGAAMAGGLLACPAAQAYDITDYLSVGGTVALGEQCLVMTESAGTDNTCNGGLVVQPEASLRPVEGGELFVKFGFGGGNGIDNDTPFTLSAWAVDNEDGVKDLNGRGRDYLLTAWYRQEIEFAPGRFVAVSGGIIDATDYLDDNAYANDEFTQFMNEAFVNSPVANLASYDYGGAIELGFDAWSARAVVMSVGENDDGNGYMFYGGQIGYSTETPLGPGTFRLVVTGTDRQFLDPDGGSLESLTSVTFSADQELAPDIGAFLRVGWQKSDAAVDYDGLVSGGLQIGGGRWGRDDDTVGLGYAYLSGGNGDLNGTHVAEAYYRLAVVEALAITADVQFMSDDVKSGGGPSGFILGLRGTLEF